MKKLCHWIVLLCISLNCGCGVVPAWNKNTVYRNHYHKWYPDAQPLYDSLYREQALKVLQEVMDDSIKETRGPCIVPKAPNITESGIAFVFKIIIKHKQYVGGDIGFNNSIVSYQQIELLVWYVPQPRTIDTTILCIKVF